MTPAARPIRKRAAADLPRSRSRREDRAQPAGVHRVAPARRGKRLQVDRIVDARAGEPPGGAAKAERSRSSGSTRAICRRSCGDPLLLQQALLNIVINAEQRWPTGDGPRRIDDHVRADREAADDVIVDDPRHGPGIPAEVLPRIFEPFFTTKEVGKGTARPGDRLRHRPGARRHIHAANHPDGGAVFTVELPEDRTTDPSARV